MPRRDSEATRARILNAAVAEFSRHGLAGGRVDRIASAAGSNKRLIYVYYGDKEGLFEAALTHVLSTASETVPVTPDDLPGFAGRMFDYVQRRPEALRMNLWRTLERPGAGPDDTSAYEENLRAMVSSGAGDARGDLASSDLIVLIVGLATSWTLSPPGLRNADGSDPASAPRLAQHREAVVEAARRIADQSATT